MPRAGAYDFSVLGPNGFFRRFAGNGADAVEATFSATGQFVVVNNSTAPVTLHDGYGTGAAQAVPPGQESVINLDLARTANWYDVSVVGGGFVRHFAGHIENGKPSRSDPLLG